MIKLEFNDLAEIVEFLTITKEFEGWETVLFRLTVPNGLEMNIKTKATDTLGLLDYLEFNKLKSMLTSFYNQNKHTTINLEIKFKFPDSQRKVMDITNVYNAFYLTFYADGKLFYANTGFLENNKTLASKPIISWGVYVTGIYNEWRRSRGDY